MKEIVEAVVIVSAVQTDCCVIVTLTSTHSVVAILLTNKATRPPLCPIPLASLTPSSSLVCFQSCGRTLSGFTIHLEPLPTLPYRIEPPIILKPLLVVFTLHRSITV